MSKPFKHITKQQFIRDGVTYSNNSSVNKFSFETWNSSLKSKARIENIQDFSDDEVNRVFNNTACEKGNIQQFKRLINEGLTIEELYNVS